MKHPTRTSRVVLFLEKYLGWLLLSILKSTYRYQLVGNPFPKDRSIYVFWHQSLLAMMLSRAHDSTGVMISSSFDGELIAGPAEMFGFKAIRGSSSRRGFGALKEMVRHGRSHCLAITPDGPKGPAFKIKPGAAYLALLSGLPLVPVTYWVDRKWQFNSWDKLVVPKPFARIEVRFLEPVFVHNTEEIPAVCTQMEEKMLASVLGHATD